MSGECPVNRTVYGHSCDGPGTYYCDSDLWGSRCRAYFEQKREESRPAAPVVQGADELRDDLIAALAGLPRAEWDGVREAERLRIVHGAAADRLLSGPLAQLLADAADGREAFAKVQRVRAWIASMDDLATQYREAAAAVTRPDLAAEAAGHAEDVQASADGVRRALGEKP
jgi:hypothetical protein